MYREITLITLALCCHNQVYASPNCQQLENLKMEVSILASNITNLNTTRTPDGGPYKRQIWLCESGKCKVDVDPAFITKHLPGHPDADQEGNVKFPKINIKEQMTEMLSAADQIEDLTNECSKPLPEETGRALRLEQSQGSAKAEDAALIESENL